jgi:hypothetical protein
MTINKFFTTTKELLWPPLGDGFYKALHLLQEESGKWTILKHDDTIQYATNDLVITAGFNRVLGRRITVNGYPVFNWREESKLLKVAEKLLLLKLADKATKEARAVSEGHKRALKTLLGHPQNA